MTSATVAQLRFACRCFVKGRGKGSKGRGTGRGRGRGNNDKGNDKGGGGGPGRGSAGSAGSAGSGGSGTGTGGSSSSGSGGGSDNVGGSDGGGNVGGGGGEETEEAGNPGGRETGLSPEEEEDYISHLMNELKSDASPGDESDSGSDGDDGSVSKVSGKLLQAVQEEEEMVAALELAHAERKTKTAGIYNKVVTIAAEQEIQELQRGGAPAPDNAAELLVAVASGCQILPSSDTGSNAGTGIGNASSSSSGSGSSSSTTGGNAGNSAIDAIDMWSKWTAACWNSFCSIAQMCHDMSVHPPHLVAHSVALVSIDSKSKKLGSTSSFELVYIDRLNLESERPEVTLRRIGSKLGKVHYLPASSQKQHPLETVSVLVPNIGAHMVRPKLERQDVPQHIARVMEMLEVASDPQVAFGLNDACMLCKRYVSSAEALNAGVPSLSSAVTKSFANIH
jgi:hypothetical protein